jgi:hypothetical protein
MVCGKLVLRTSVSRAYWNEVDVGLTVGKYNIVHLLASNVGNYATYRAIYDRLHYEGLTFGAGRIWATKAMGCGLRNIGGREAKKRGR